MDDTIFAVLDIVAQMIRESVDPLTEDECLRTVGKLLGPLQEGIECQDLPDAHLAKDGLRRMLYPLYMRPKGPWQIQWSPHATEALRVAMRWWHQSGETIVHSAYSVTMDRSLKINKEIEEYDGADERYLRPLKQRLKTLRQVSVFLQSIME